jgi:hypothetical protein
MWRCGDFSLDSYSVNSDEEIRHKKLHRFYFSEAKALRRYDFFTAFNASSVLLF